MIYCIGLPRCGGQTLHFALKHLFPGRDVWHAIEHDKWNVVTKNCVAIVECFAPIEWCIESFNLEPHIFIINDRDPDEWFASCKKFRERSHDHHWNHPLWQYPESQWSEYRLNYIHQSINALSWYGANYFVIDVTKQNDYSALINGLGYSGPVQPTAVWPNLDKFGRLAPHKCVEDMLAYDKLADPFQIPGQIL